MQTALRDLIQWCIENAFDIEGQNGTQYIAIDYKDMRKLFDNLLAKERQQIIDAFDKGQRDMLDVIAEELAPRGWVIEWNMPADDKEDAEAYYSETFKAPTHDR